jgi:4-hydroxy-tetrahydrodipicolinate reductase
MGVEIMQAVHHAPDLELCAAIDRESVGQSVRDLVGARGPDIEVKGRVGTTLEECRPDVVLDFTHVSAAPDHAMSALKRQIPVIIGTSGLTVSDLSALREACTTYETPAAVVPNFALGAVLLARFTESAARWMKDVEIVETQPRDHVESPSAFALHLADRIGEARTERPVHHDHAVEKVPGARGARLKDTCIHSVRLPGSASTYEVIFGAEGERFSVRHDATDRRCMVPGVLLAIRKIRSMNGLVVGLEKFLD